VWWPFYGTHIDRIERVQKKLVRYGLRGLGWTGMFALPPYVDRCALNDVNEFAGLFNLHLLRNKFFDRLRSVL
jgi:hypothetical protein